MKKTYLINLLMALGAIAIITYFFPHPEANHYKFEEGRPWNYAKLIAPFDVPIRPDSLTVKSVRDSLDRTFAPVFKRNANAADDVITMVMAQWAQGSETSADEEAMRRRSVAFLRKAYQNDIIDNVNGHKIAEGYMPQLRILRNNVVSRHSTQGIISVDDVLKDMASTISDDSVAAKNWMVANGIDQLLIPNLEYEREMSDNLYQEDLNQLNARMGAVMSGVIQQGQTIIDKGAIITPQDYTNLMTYERMVDERMSRHHTSRWMQWLGQGLYVLLIFGALLAFLRFSSPKVWTSPRAMLFVMLSITLFFVVSVLLDDAIDNAAYLVPFAIVPVLMIVFFDASTALFTSLALTLVTAGAVAFPLEFIVLEVLATVAAVYSLRELAKRQQLLRTALFVMVSYLLGYLAIEMMMNGSLQGAGWNMVIYLTVSAALTSMAYILMVAVEKAFGFVSVVTLIELSDTNNPILRELSEECPGTFQHSVAVGNLAADAAMKIGANEQLVRAGAMYHDMGKMSNPNFYTENQRGVNPHDVLPADQSARIIIGHIADGLERADKAGLPEEIKDFIRQHHGKGKAKYFFYNYCAAHPGEDVDPTPFTYPGPNPKTREASLLMMADSVEAASRSLKEHTQASISELVNKIIDGQIAEGLHNESTLMFSDVATIKDAFVKRLMTMYHARVEYPDAPTA